MPERSSKSTLLSVPEFFAGYDLATAFARCSNQFNPASDQGQIYSVRSIFFQARMLLVASGRSIRSATLIIFSYPRFPPIQLLTS